MDVITLIVLEGAMGSSVAISLDVLRTANQIAEVMGRPTITWKIIGSSESVQMRNGMRLEALPLSKVKAIEDSTLVIPGLGLENAQEVNLFGCRTDKSPRGPGHSLATELINRLGHHDISKLGKLVRQHDLRGQQTAASCSAVFVLGDAEILEGRTVTTHWQLYDQFKARYPKSILDTKRMLIHDGNIVTAGAGMSQMDLMLYILRIKMGNTIASLTMQYLLVDGRPAQYHYMALSNLKTESREVLMLEKFIENCLPNVPPLSVIAEHLNVTEKTLSRRIRHATGKSPMAFVQKVRLQHVQSLLETTNLSIEMVALKVGYSDSTALRRLMWKNMGCTPSQLRKARSGPPVV
ncbi:Transcriptional regulator GlxA family, contains an amidase domain and an AraC-type DNA-binding HTH domain [Pseudomonas asturiensis]|uniref:Transcriptional regulator GlxA family, contains an amidase domain and an AraC-type DNA-binding HTH domain n=1 Tax=Pseudomonas asturiensis TaxID=1190415 RepID=A0A1M7ND96_9PSED|nr:helix-turn-helix domain-containing protein [Pseudomonas asturiensis]SHN01132.1 Transcriptional regulator GlxA family, contains an amidase domain and an AraC-type DNA-binding HTH domain [Pseudomonas asturiensis]